MSKKKKTKSSTQQQSKKNQPFNSSWQKSLKQVKNTLTTKADNPKTKTNQDPIPPSEDTLWEQSISGVTPLDKDNIVTPPEKIVSMRTLKNEDEEVLDELHALIDGHASFRIENSDEYQAGFVEGLDSKTILAVKRGEYPWSLHLDLHGFTKDEAKSKLERFIHTARRGGHRCVLIVTGRGLSSPNKQSVLKETFPKWISRGSIGNVVLAYCTAQPKDGGSGAFYVLLKKSGRSPYVPISKEE